jgi:integrase
VAWNLLVRNVAEAANPPKKQRAKIKTWRAEQLRTFLSSVRGDRLYAAWMVAALTGMRRGEVLGLKWSDLDLDHGRLKIDRALILVDYVPAISETKTDKGRRTVALDSATVAALQEHDARQAVEAAMAGDAWENDEGYVFTDELGRVIHPQAFTDRSDRLGHASTAFTMDTYADALPAVEETAAAMVTSLVLGDDLVQPINAGGARQEGEGL